VADTQYSHRVKIKNNIFYSVHNPKIIVVEDTASLTFECDYNVYWIEDGDNQPKFYIESDEHTFAQWQAHGFDLHSKIIGAQTYDKIIILGFSQGGATAARWFYDNRKNADHLIMWASVFPPDLSPEDLIDQHSTNNLFILGTEDEYFDGEQQKEALDFYSMHGFRTISYPGKHDICIETLVDSLNHLK
jgi:predicted esterase